MASSCLSRPSHSLQGDSLTHGLLFGRIVLCLMKIGTGIKEGNKQSEGKAGGVPEVINNRGDIEGEPETETEVLHG